MVPSLRMPVLVAQSLRMRVMMAPSLRRLGGKGMLVAAFCWVAGAAVEASPGRYLEQGAFLESALGADDAEQAALFVDASLRESIEDVLERKFGLLRVRYWRAGGRTAWILDEVGKEEPITIGVAIEDGAVKMVRVLEFRETRGWEVRYPFFTDQFNGAKLAKNTSIDRSIDGITGATLSVRAVGRVVRVALLLHERTQERNAGHGQAAKS